MVVPHDLGNLHIARMIPLCPVHQVLCPHTDRNKCIVCRDLRHCEGSSEFHRSLWQVFNARVADIRLHSGCVHLFQP